jgi:hypothetical protein
MEDPQKLADAMRTITEQAIEIKDILSEMNMMGGTRKRTPRPQMVDEPTEKPMAPPVRSVTQRAAILPVEDSGDEPEQPAVQKLRRPGPVVPYGPPPEMPKRQPQLPDQEVEFPSRPAARRPQEEVEFPPRPAARRSQEEERDYPQRPVSRLTRKPYFPEQEESQPEAPAHHRQVRTKKSGNAVLMLFAGLLIGAVATYLLSMAGVLPALQWTSIQPREEPQMIDLPKEETPYSEEPVVTDSLLSDSLTTDNAVKPAPIDSLQLLFDTPRNFSEFIASEEVRDGSRMTRISERHYGAKEFWVYIYEANRNLLNHPDDITRGMVLKIPRVDPRLIDKNNPRCIEYAVELHDKYLKK